MMHRKSFLFRVSCLVIYLSQVSMVVFSSDTSRFSINAVQVRAPLLAGMNTNPVIKLEINVQRGTKEVTLQKLFCTLNPAAARSLEKVDIFASGAMDEFGSSRRITSVSPASGMLEIPLDIQLPPGRHRLWVSAVVKTNAHPDDIVDIHVNKVSADAKLYPVAEAYSSYKRHIGIAIRKRGDNNVHTFRIPGMVTTDKGTLLAVYDVRYNNAKDLPENIDVGLSRSTDGGKTWEPMKIIMDMGAPHENNGVGDPCILFDPVTKKIWVAALWSKGNRSIAGSSPGLSPDTTGQFVLATSNDDGLTWSAPYSITPQVKDPAWHLYFQGPGSGIAMKDGTLVFPSQYWDEQKKPGIPHSAIIYSKDHGKTWQSGTGAKANTTESQVVETTPGTLMLNMRDNRGKFRSIAVTNDMGRTWKADADAGSALPDPVCMGSFIKASVPVNGSMKEVLFFSNPDSPLDRYNMTVKASLDMGKTWLPANQLLVDERGCYGYSTLTKIDDKTIGMLYEGTGDLYFVRLPIAEIIK